MKLSGTLKSNFVFALIVLIGLGVYALAVTRRQALPELLSYYSETFLLDTKDFAYERVEPALFDRALVFYGVRFPGIPVPHRVSRMQIAETQGRLSVSLDGIAVDVMRAVESLHADQIEQIMRRYVPFDSVAAYPFESMLLAGIRYFDGRLRLVFEPTETNKMRLSGFLSGKDVADVSFILTVEAVPHFRPFSFVFGSPVFVQATFRDKGALSGYLNYARHAGVLTPRDVSALEQPKTFKLDKPLSDIFQ